MLKHKYICTNICKYTLNNIHKRGKVISTDGIRKGIMNNNMKTKYTEYKIKRRKLCILQRKILHDMKIL